MTTTDYVPVDALQNYIDLFIEESEKQQGKTIKMFNSENAEYYEGIIGALEALKERIDEMKVSL